MIVLKQSISGGWKSLIFTGWKVITIMTLSMVPRGMILSTAKTVPIIFMAKVAMIGLVLKKWTVPSRLTGLWRPFDQFIT